MSIIARSTGNIRKRKNNKITRKEESLETLSEDHE